MRRWVIWTIVVVGWTVALELPVPGGDATPGDIVWTAKLMAAKALHVTVYAGITVLSAWVPTPARYRWLLTFFLMGHAWGTEMLQEVLEPWCHRGGSLLDVGFDISGVVIGLLGSWRWWTRD